LPEVVPGANINSAGICAYCLGYEDAAASGEEERRKKREADLEQALRDCRDKGSMTALSLSVGARTASTFCIN
jgi:hypothetical protein